MWFTSKEIFHSLWPLLQKTAKQLEILISFTCAWEFATTMENGLLKPGVERISWREKLRHNFITEREITPRYIPETWAEATREAKWTLWFIPNPQCFTTQETLHLWRARSIMRKSSPCWSRTLRSEPRRKIE